LLRSRTHAYRPRATRPLLPGDRMLCTGIELLCAGIDLLCTSRASLRSRLCTRTVPTVLLPTTTSADVWSSPSLLLTAFLKKTRSGRSE
jgi:hypothetical protein